MPACEVTVAPGYLLVAYEVHSSNLFLRRIDYVLFSTFFAVQSKQQSKTKLGRHVALIKASHAVFREAVIAENVSRVLRKFFSLASKS